MIGTPLYLAPELFAGHPATIASDIYSIGVLLYHLMTGRYPVEGATFDAIATLDARQHTIGLSERRPDLPARLVRIVDDALAADPARRYRSASAMEEDLRSVLELQNALDETVAHEVMSRSAVGSRRSPCCRSRASDPTKISSTSARTRGRAPDRSGQGARVACRIANIVPSREPDRHRYQARLPTARRRHRVGGTVRKAGDRVRISAQLVSAEDGCHPGPKGTIAALPMCLPCRTKSPGASSTGSKSRSPSSHGNR